MIPNADDACGRSQGHCTWGVSNRAATLLFAGSNLMPLSSLGPQLSKGLAGALNSDSSQRGKAQVPRLTKGKGQTHLGFMSGGPRNGLSWLETLEPAFLELSWKGALLGEAEN